MILTEDQDVARTYSLDSNYWKNLTLLGKGDYKCNLFVAHVLERAGVPYSFARNTTASTTRQKWNRFWGADVEAYPWHSKDWWAGRVPGFQRVEVPTPGTVMVSTPLGRHGHVGICVGFIPLPGPGGFPLVLGLYVSATENGVELKTFSLAGGVRNGQQWSWRYLDPMAPWERVPPPGK